MGRRRLSLIIEEQLETRFNKYMEKTYPISEIHGKITEIITVALDAFLTREGY